MNIFIYIYLYIYICILYISLQEIRHLNQRINNMRQRLYRASRRKRCSWNSTRRSKLVAVSIYVQSNYSDETVMQYLLRKRGKRSFGYDEKAEDACHSSPIRDWFLDVPFSVLQEIAVEPVSKPNTFIFEEARRFISEMRTCAWLEKENIENGRTVSSVELVQYYCNQLKREHPDNCEEECNTVETYYPIENKFGGRGIRVVNTMRKWCCRFKRNWQIRHGQMIEREFMPPAELRDKAGIFV